MNSLTRRNFLGRCGLAAPGMAAAARARGAQRSPGKLNFIIILIDDYGWTDSGCYGSTFYETPNIDRLAREGMRFTNAYAACPVCSPTRASILTGKYPARLHLTDWIPGRKQWATAKLLGAPFYQELPLWETTIAERLRPLGYATAAMGKWHLGQEPYYPERQGFDINVAGTFRGHPASYFGPFDLPNFRGWTKSDYLTDRLTDKALQFLEENQQRPFFLYLAHFAVHTPLQAKAEMIAKYERKAQGRKLQNNPTYAAMIESMDEGVGRVMRKLEDLNIADRTVILFTSDNGGLMYEGGSKTPVTSNRPLRAGKGHLYEGGVRVPLIVRWPGVVKPGRTCDVPASSVDYFPTIEEMAGLRHDSKTVIDGVSLVPLLRQRGGLAPRALYWHYPHYSNQGGQPGAAIREGNLKLIEFYEDSHLELYDLSEDIGERHNLAREMPDKAAELHAKLKAWRASVKATMPTVNPNYDPATADQGLTGADPAHQ